MADSYNEYTGNGSTKTFTVSFPYISKSHVKVYVNNTAMLNPSDWQWNGSQVTFTYAPQSGAVVKIKRDTPRNTRLVDFQPGAVLTEADLDLAHLQHHYSLQELYDGYESLLDGAKTRLAGSNGIAITEAEELIDNMVAEVLASSLAATLTSAINDIDTNGQNVLDIDARMLDLESTVDALANINGTGITTFLQNEQTARIAGDNALATDISLIGAANAGDTAFILNSATVKLDTDAGATIGQFVNEVHLLGAKNAAGTAFILDENTVKIGSDSGDTVAQRFSAIQSEVDGNTATIVTQASAINGLEAEYTVKVDVNGKVAGFGLATTETASSFIIAANKFAVIDPGNTASGTTVTPFVVSGGTVYMQNVVVQNALIESLDAGKISTGTLNTNRLNLDGLVLGNSGGQLTINGSAITTAHLGNGVVTNAKIASLAVGTANIQSAAITNAKIGSAAITEAKIASLAVSTLKIANNAVTLPSGSYSSSGASVTWNGGNGGIVTSVSINPESAPVFVIFSFYRARSGDDGNAYVKVTRGGTTLMGWVNHKTVDQDARTHVTVMHYDANPGSGTHTYYCYARPGDSSDTWTCYDRSAFAIGMKK